MQRRDIFILAGKIYVKKNETTKQKLEIKFVTEIPELT